MLGLTVTTFEYDEKGKPELTLTHIFWGKTLEDAIKIAKSHSITDSFFRASFEGEFEWKGATIQLVNKYNEVRARQLVPKHDIQPERSSLKRAVEQLRRMILSFPYSSERKAGGADEQEEQDQEVLRHTLKAHVFRILE